MNAILSTIVQGAVLSVPVTAAVWLALRVTPRRVLNAATRYAIWWIALAVAIGLPLFLMPTPAVPPRAESSKSTIVYLASSQPLPETAPAPIPKLRNEPSTPALQPPLRFRSGSWLVWIAIAWIVTSAILLLRLLMSHIAMEGRKQRACPAPQRLAEQLDAWRSQCATQRPIQLLLSTEIPAPVASGPRHASILFPAALVDELSAAELEQAGLHECAHLARRDDVALLTQRVLEALFPLHPAVRFITRQIDLEREIACDDFVVAATGAARPYAACLTRLAEVTGSRTSLAASAAAGSHLTRRIDMLLDKTRHTGLGLLKTRLAAAGAVLAALAWIAGQTPVLIAFAPEPQPQVAMAPPPALPPIAFAAQVPQQPAAAVPPSRPVVVPVTVALVSNGKIVAGLEQRNFRVFDNDVEQQITRMSTGPAPASTAIVIDAHEGSRLADSLGDILSLGGADEYIGVLVHGPLQTTSRFPPNVEMLPGQPTGLQEAVSRAAVRLQTAANPRRAILVLTDGGEGSFGYTEERLRAELRAAGARLDVLSSGNTSTSALSLLERLAPETGGSSGLVSGRNRMLLADRHQYILEFVPSVSLGPGTLHSLRVELANTQGLPELQVRARSFYFERR